MSHIEGKSEKFENFEKTSETGQVELMVTARGTQESEKDKVTSSLTSNLADWNSDDDPANPRNWTSWRKWSITLILSGFAVLPPLSSTILAPSQFAIGEQLGIANGVVLEICLSIFNLGVGIGPLLMSPLSETYGRYSVVLLGNVFFLAWNTGLGFVQTERQLIVCRLFTGFGASASLSVMSAVVGDIWPPERRARAVGIATLLPLLGPAIGPIAGGYITQYVSWRWILWIVSIVDAVLLAVAVRFLSETYAPLILERRARLRGDIDRQPSVQQRYPVLKKVCINLARPFTLLGTKRIIQATCAFSGVLYGTLFLNLYSYPLLWTNIYHQNPGPGSLNYISTGLGYILGAQVIGRINDHMYIALKKRNGGVGHPKYRLPLLFPAAILLAGGLVVLGWTGQKRVFWLIPNIGNLLFQAGSVLASQIITTYTIDAFALHAASALSTNNFVRSVTAFSFPLFAPAMYDRLDWGWSSTLLGLVTSGFILSIGCYLWFYAADKREQQ